MSNTFSQSIQMQQSSPLKFNSAKTISAVLSSPKRRPKRNIKKIRMRAEELPMGRLTIKVET